MNSRCFLTASSLLLLIGCSSGAIHFMREGVPAADAPRVETQVTFRKLWRRDLGRGYANSNFLLTPFFTAGRIYAAEPKGTVSALDSASGDLLWQRDLDQSLAAGVGGDNSVVVVATRGGEVIALAPDDGVVRWRRKVGSEVLAKPVVAQGTVLLRSGDGQVIGLSGASGEVAWRVRRAVPALSVRGLSAPLVIDDVAVAGFASGRLAGISVASGAELWNVPISRPSGSNVIDRLVDIDADPHRVGDLLFVAAYQSRITAVSLQTQRVKWKNPISTIRPMGSTENRLLVTADDGSVNSIDISTGQIQWSQSRLRGRGVSGPLGLGTSGYAVVGDYQGYLYAIDVNTGGLLGRNKGRGGAILGLFATGLDEQFVTLSENGALTGWSGGH